MCPEVYIKLSGEDRVHENHQPCDARAGVCLAHRSLRPGARGLVPIISQRLRGIPPAAEHQERPERWRYGCVQRDYFGRSRARGKAARNRGAIADSKGCKVL